MAIDPIIQAKYLTYQQKYKDKNPTELLEALYGLITSSEEGENRKIEIFAVEDLYLKHEDWAELTEFYKSKIPTTIMSISYMKKMRYSTYFIKVSICIFLIIASIKPMHESYYSIMKLICFTGFLSMSIYESKRENFILKYISIIGALVFNPIYLFGFRRSEWQFIDIACVLILFVWLIIEIAIDFKIFIKK